MNRRDFIKAGVFNLGLLSLSPSLSFGAGNQDIPGAKTLVLIELKGGNDGLNMLVPTGDKNYYEQRPRLAISKNDALPLASGFGLHPSMKDLQELYSLGHLAIVQGLGYEDPNRSHFRSIDIWETASGSDEYLDEGWIAQQMKERSEFFSSYDLNGLVLGNDDLGPLMGNLEKTLVLQNPKAFFKQAGRIKEKEYKDTKNPALNHIRNIKTQLRQAALDLKKRLDRAPRSKMKFPKSRVGQSCETIVKLLASGLKPAVLKLTLPGFDTHASQKNQHARLLKQLSEGMGLIYQGLDEFSLSDKVVIATYSEFGRRVRENGSLGTDHGTAAPHLVLGKGIRGGLHGQAPSLTDLDQGDLKYTTHFKDYYKALSHLCFQTSLDPSSNLKLG